MGPTAFGGGTAGIGACPGGYQPPGPRCRDHRPVERDLFRFQAFGFALLWLALLWVLVLWMTVLFYRVKPWAGYLQIPYLVWITFAAYLNSGVWRLNSL